MRALVLSIGLLLGVTLGGGTAVACQTDSDCDAGSSCQIQDGRIDGVCVNDAAPPPDDEQETVETPPIDDDSNAGDACQTSRDCGVGGRCVKQPGATAGTCTGGM